MKLKKLFLGLSFLCLINTVFSQNGLQGIIVEKYYQTNAADAADATSNGATLVNGSVAYRVYVDMAPGYKFVQLYGSANHNLKIGTTTNFFNDPNYGVATNPLTISATNIKKNTAMIDTWLTMGGVANGKAGILKSEDSDGSVGNTTGILANNAGDCYGDAITGASSKDGMTSSSASTVLTPTILGITATQLNLFDQTSGSNFLVTNGSIAALGGIVGATSSNMVLIGQFTTDGILSYELNVQLLSPNGTQEKWVASNPVTGEYTNATLKNTLSPTIISKTISGASTVCSGTNSTTLSLASGTVGTIQWQSALTNSINQSDWTNEGSEILPTNTVNSANSLNQTNLNQSKWFRVKLTSGECTVYSSPVQIVVNPSSVSGAISGQNGLCTSNTGSSLTLSGQTGTIQWEKATVSSGGVGTFTPISGATSSTYSTGALTSSTAYRVVVSSPNCPTATSSNFVITVDPVAIAGTAAVNDASGLIVCSGGSKALKITGNTGSIQWQSSSNGGTSWTNVTGATTSPYTFNNISSNTSYRAIITNGGCSTTATTNVIAITTTAAPIAGTVSASVSTICSGGSSTLTLNGSSGTIVWQKATVTAGVVGTFAATTGTTNTLSTGALTATTAFRAVLTTTSACSQATTANILVNVDKAAVAGTITAATSVCTAGNITLSLTGYTGTSFQWQSAPTATGTFTNISGATSATYTASNVSSATNKNYKVIVTSGVCTTTAISAVKSFLMDVPSVAGTISGGAAICSAGGGSLSLTGNTGTIQWQSSTDDGATWTNVTGATTATYTASNLLTDTKFRATVKNGACPITYTFPSIFTIVSTPVAGTISGEQNLCVWNNETTLTLNNNVGSIKWEKASITSGVVGTFAVVSGATSKTLSTGALTANTAYRATVSIGACASDVQTSNFIVTVGQYVVPKAITASVTTPTGATSSTALCTTNTSKVLTLGAGYVGNIQWQKYSSTTGWTNIAGATSATYTITNPTVGGNFFRVKLSVGDCSEGYSTNVMAVWYKGCLVVNKIETNDNVVNGETVRVIDEKSLLVDENKLISFDAVAFPNPFEDHFTINLLTENQDQVILNLFDMSGKVLENYSVSPFEIENIQLGKELTSGIYNVLVTQGNSVKTLRIIKK